MLENSKILEMTLSEILSLNQNYKMKCCRCGEEMNYIEDKEMEKLGFISMDCPNGCDGGYLIPYNNPNLQKL